MRAAVHTDSASESLVGFRPGPTQKDPASKVGGMGQLQNVSWRTVGYSALGTAVAAASVIAVFNSDGVHPTALTSSAATKWLVDNENRQVVLVDGLAGHVVARVQLDPETDSGTREEAVQGTGGAFLIDRSQASVRTISTSKLQLGTPQTVGLLNEQHAKFGVGASGLTILSPDTKEARVVAVDDVTRSVKNITASSSSRIAFDGSIWLFAGDTATHVMVDRPNDVESLRSSPKKTTTMGSRAVAFDPSKEVVEWPGGGTVAVDSIPNASEAGLQEPGDDASCVWLAVGDNLDCIGTEGIEQTLVIPGLDFNAAGDRLAISGSAAAVVRGNNRIDRIDLAAGTMANDDNTPSTRPGAQLDITATGSLVWIDDTLGTDAWVVHRLGVNPIDKNDEDASVFDAQGQPADDGTGSDDGSTAGNTIGDQESDENHFDNDGEEDPPVAVPDSVTGRAGNVITIPVTGNDYDPDRDPIAVVRVGNNGNKAAGHGTTDVLSSTSVAYRPDAGYSGQDTFQYTITDPSGEESTTLVTVELFAPGSPNQPPIARPDPAKTKPGRDVTIDVLANDIDPERDQLTVSTFAQKPGDTAKITANAKGPSGLPALLYHPPDEPGFYEFTYQAADPQGGLSQKTTVTVQVSATNAPNEPPVANPDSIRLPVGTVGHLDVKANDLDPDGEDLFLVRPLNPPNGVTAVIRGQQLDITLKPGAAALSIFSYTISAGSTGPTAVGQVLVVRVGDAEKNLPPVANPDSERVVIGNSVKIPVTVNDVDPDLDPIGLLTVTTPANGAGTTAIEGNSVRFAPTLQDITEPTPVTFSYTIDDGQGHEATGKVTVTVLLEAVPAAPFARDDFGDTEVGKPVTIDVLANDSDPSGGKPSLAGTPACPSGGSATISNDERVVFTPPATPGTVRCKYTVINQQRLPATAFIVITVTPAAAGNH